MPNTVEQLSSQLGLDCFGNMQMRIESVANFSKATRSQLKSLVSDNNKGQLNHQLDCAVIKTSELADNIKADALIISANPQLSFVKAARLILAEKVTTACVHQDAVIAESAKLDATVNIAAGVVIEENVNIGPAVSIGSNVSIGKDTIIEKDTKIDANVTIYPNTRIGKGCQISSGAVIGSPGFGIVPDGDQWVRFPQLGRVIIGDNVDIGANCSIDRGALDDTVIESGVKLDNLIQIAHNVCIGENTVIAACTGIAGSAKIGRNCRIGGRASIQGHITIVDNVVITTCTFVNKSIFKPGVYSASLSAQENTTWLKNQARLYRLDKLSRQFNKIERQCKRLTDKGEGSDK